jgi:hypothetical protein
VDVREIEEVAGVGAREMRVGITEHAFGPSGIDRRLGELV